MINDETGILLGNLTCLCWQSRPGRYHSRMIPSQSTTTQGADTSSALRGGNSQSKSRSRVSLRPVQCILRCFISVTYLTTDQLIFSTETILSHHIREVVLLTLISASPYQQFHCKIAFLQKFQREPG